jgi:hypothetical protein
MTQAERSDADKDGKGDARRSPREALRDTWMQLAGLVSTAEDKGVTWLLDLAGIKHEHGGDIRAEIVAHVKKNREALEKKVDDGVRATLAKMRAPLDRELAQLKARIEKLQAKVDRRKHKDDKAGESKA